MDIHHPKQYPSKIYLYDAFEVVVTLVVVVVVIIIIIIINENNKKKRDIRVPKMVGNGCSGKMRVCWNGGRK